LIETISAFFAIPFLLLLICSLVLNAILLYRATRKQYGLVLDKLHVKLKYLELEYKLDEEGRIKFLNEEIKRTKKQLKEAESEKNKILWLLAAAFLFAGLFAFLSKIREDKNTQNKIPPKIDEDSFISEALPEDQNDPELLLKQLDEIEEIANKPNQAKDIMPQNPKDELKLKSQKIKEHLKNKSNQNNHGKKEEN